jgi:hypothetical protein
MSDSDATGKCSGSFVQCMTSMLIEEPNRLIGLAGFAGLGRGRGRIGVGIDGFSFNAGLDAGECTGFLTGGGVCNARGRVATGTSSFKPLVSCATTGRGFVSICGVSSLPVFNPAAPAALDAASLHDVPEVPNL